MSLKGGFVRFILLTALLFIGFVAKPVQALDFDEDDTETTVAPVKQNRATLRLYNGGRDEQELRVQATLPAPTKSADGLSHETATIETPAAVPPSDGL